jgi:beta-phosphoglucomutase-like phosphatase (HAD superfamily)
MIQAVLIEPVGCLAEFAPDEFAQIASDVFHRPPTAVVSGSAAYWQVLDAMAATSEWRESPAHTAIERCEINAADRAKLYEDVVPSLAELKAMGLQLIVASSLCAAAVTHFLERHALADFFADIWTRDTADGIKVMPLARALDRWSLEPSAVIFLTDTADGVIAAKQAGVNAVLMMNDPDEAMRLTALGPAGGIVSLHELPDFVRMVLADRGQPFSRTSPGSA